MTTDAAPYYRPIDCEKCGRRRVLSDGVCEKCRWDHDRGEYRLASEMAADRVGESWITGPPGVTDDTPFPTPPGYTRTGPHSMVADTPANREKIARGETFEPLPEDVRDALDKLRRAKEDRQP